MQSCDHEQIHFISKDTKYSWTVGNDFWFSPWGRKRNNAWENKNGKEEMDVEQNVTS